MAVRAYGLAVVLRAGERDVVSARGTGAGDGLSGARVVAEEIRGHDAPAYPAFEAARERTDDAHAVNDFLLLAAAALLGLTFLNGCLCADQGGNIAAVLKIAGDTPPVLRRV